MLKLVEAEVNFLQIYIYVCLFYRTKKSYQVYIFQFRSWNVTKLLVSFYKYYVFLIAYNDCASYWSWTERIKHLETATYKYNYLKNQLPLRFVNLCLLRDQKLFDFRCCTAAFSKSRDKCLCLIRCDHLMRKNNRNDFNTMNPLLHRKNVNQFLLALLPYAQKAFCILLILYSICSDGRTLKQICTNLVVRKATVCRRGAIYSQCICIAQNATAFL